MTTRKEQRILRDDAIQNTWQDGVKTRHISRLTGLSQRRVQEIVQPVRGISGSTRTP